MKGHGNGVLIGLEQEYRDGVSGTVDCCTVQVDEIWGTEMSLERLAPGDLLSNHYTESILSRVDAVKITIGCPSYRRLSHGMRDWYNNNGGFTRMLLSGLDYSLQLVASVRPFSLLFKSCLFSTYIFCVAVFNRFSN